MTTCEQAGALLAADDFWLHGTYSSGARSSAHWSFDADDVFARASRAKCLSGLTLMLSKNVQPPPKQMALIIESAGGKVAKRLPPAPSGEEQSVYFAVLALPQDKVRARQRAAASSARARVRGPARACWAHARTCAGLATLCCRGWPRRSRSRAMRSLGRRVSCSQ